MFLDSSSAILAKTAEDFYDFWHNGQSDKWKTDGFNNNTHPTELSPDYLAPKYKDALKGYFVLYGSVNRYEDLYKIWRIINHDGTVELMHYDNILREFDEDQYMEVIYRRNYYYYRNYPNKLYVNGIQNFYLSTEELRHVEKSKTTIQLKKEEMRRWEKKWNKQNATKSKE